MLIVGDCLLMLVLLVQSVFLLKNFPLFFFVFPTLELLWHYFGVGLVELDCYLYEIACVQASHVLQLKSASAVLMPRIVVFLPLLSRHVCRVICY